MLWKTVVATITGGILCLDRVALHLMISRPIVVAPTVGLFLGDIKTGLYIGAVVELMWMDRQPIGNYIPPNDSLTAVVMTAASIIVAGEVGYSSKQLIALTVLLLLPLGFFSQKMDMILVRINDKVFDSILDEIQEKGDTKRLEREHWKSLMRYWISYQAFILAGTVLGTGLVFFIYNSSGKNLWKVLEIMYFMLPVFGFSVALRAVDSSNKMIFYSLVFLLVIVLFVVYGAHF
ncbi:MAG: PTS sugar transporter subunit IIC [Syntrophales bacterium]|nr:PTS sugar transporter subunit IIC [Syntrophales bacterium]